MRVPGVSFLVWYGKQEPPPGSCKLQQGSRTAPGPQARRTQIKQGKGLRLQGGGTRETLSEAQILSPQHFPGFSEMGGCSQWSEQRQVLEVMQDEDLAVWHCS